MLGHGVLTAMFAAPPRGDGLVVEDPADVRLRVTLDPMPRLGRLEERGLEQVLGEVMVTGQQVRRARERGRTGRHELAKHRLGVGFLAHRCFLTAMETNTRALAEVTLAGESTAAASVPL